MYLYCCELRDLESYSVWNFNNNDKNSTKVCYPTQRGAPDIIYVKINKIVPNSPEFNYRDKISKVDLAELICQRLIFQKSRELSCRFVESRLYVLATVCLFHCLFPTDI